jgi:hypothetical protein
MKNKPKGNHDLQKQMNKSENVEPDHADLTLISDNK